MSKAIAADRATPQRLFFSKIIHMPGPAAGIDSVPLTQIPRAIEFIGDFRWRSFPAAVTRLREPEHAVSEVGGALSDRIEPRNDRYKHRAQVGQVDSGPAILCE